MVRDKRAFYQLTVQMPLQALSKNFPENWVGKILCDRKGTLQDFLYQINLSYSHNLKNKTKFRLKLGIDV